MVSLENGSPAQKSELLGGDVIVGFEDKVVNSTSELYRLLGKDRINKKSTLSVIRNTRKLEIDVVPRLMAA